MKLLAKAAAFLGAFVAATSTMGCLLIMFDEAEMPKSLIK